MKKRAITLLLVATLSICLVSISATQGQAATWQHVETWDDNINIPYFQTVQEWNNYINISKDYILTVNSDTGGSTTPSGTNTYTGGTKVSIEATPDTDYAFDNWSGDTSTIENIYSSNTTITMNGDYTIQANFSSSDWEQVEEWNNEISINALTGDLIVDTQTQWEKWTQNHENTTINDGTLVLSELGSANTIVDNFEDNDISEYSGDTGAYSIDSTIVKEGSYSLYGESGGNEKRIYSTSGLDNYIEAGDNWTYYQYASTSVNSAFVFGFQDTDHYYFLNCSTQDDKFLLKRKDDTNEVLAVEYTSVPSGEWMKVEFEWKTDGTINIFIYDNANNQLGSLSANDSTWSSGGIGYSVNTASGTEYAYWDNIQIIGQSSKYDSGEWTQKNWGNFGEKVSISKLEFIQGNQVGIRRAGEPLTSSDIFQYTGSDIVKDHDLDGDTEHYGKIVEAVDQNPSDGSETKKWSMAGGGGLYVMENDMGALSLRQRTSESAGVLYEIYKNENIKENAYNWTQVFSENMDDETDGGSIEGSSLEYFNGKWDFYFCADLNDDDSWGTYKVSSDTLGGIQTKLTDTSKWYEIFPQSTDHKDPRVFEAKGDYYMTYGAGGQSSEEGIFLVRSDSGENFSEMTELQNFKDLNSEITGSDMQGGGTGIISYDEGSDKYIYSVEYILKADSTTYRWYAVSDSLDGNWTGVKTESLHSYNDSTGDGHDMQYSDYWSLDNQRYYYLSAYDPDKDSVSDLYIWDYSNDPAGSELEIISGFSFDYNLGVDNSGDNNINEWTGWKEAQREITSFDLSSGYNYSIKYRLESGENIDGYSITTGAGWNEVEQWSDNIDVEPSQYETVEVWRDNIVSRAWNLIENWSDNIEVLEVGFEQVEQWVNHIESIGEGEEKPSEPLMPVDRLITHVILPFIILFMPVLVFGEEFGKGGAVAGLILGDILIFIICPISIGLIVLVLIAVVILALKGADTL